MLLFNLVPSTPPSTPVSSPTTATTPIITTVTTPTAATTTAPPPCSVVSNYVRYTNKHRCEGEFEETKCVGSCDSNTNINFFEPPFVNRDCSCCQPSKFALRETEMKCPGSSYQHKYIVIRACECTACGTNPVQNREQFFSQVIINSTSPHNA